MSVILQAPFPGVETTTILPNPETSDTENPIHSLDIKQAMDGTKYTYVKSNPNRSLNYTFRLTRQKGLELRAFIQAYHRTLIRMTNHKNEIWDIKLINNPFSFETLNGETVIVTLQLEGI